MEYCPQSGDYAPANTDPTGRFECNHCGKTLRATPTGHRVPRHRPPAPDEAMQSVLARGEVVRAQPVYATERGSERHTRGGPVADHTAEGDGSADPTWCYCGHAFSEHLRY